MRFADEQTTTALRALVWQRFQQELSGLGSFGIGRSRDEHGEFLHFLVGNRVFVMVKLYDGPEDQFRCHLTLVNGPDVVAPVLLVDGNTIWLHNCPPDQFDRTLQQINVRLTHGLVPCRVHVPYGYVQDGVVTVFWYVLLAPGDTPGSMHTSSSTFVLEGHELPAELVAPPLDADPAEYVRRSWELVKAGVIVDLWERVVCHEGDAWLMTQDVTWPYVYFDEPDPQTPRLPENQRYLLRGTSDPVGSDLPVTRQMVATWLANGQEPVSLSDYFSQFQ